MTTNQIELIDIRLIDESKMNPRKSFDEGSLKELSESISKQGVLQPITVRVFKDKKLLLPKELSKETCYEIICGARRYKASMLAELKTVPCIIRDMTDEEAFDAMITENLQRKDVAPMDEARAFTELHKRGDSFEELAARFGKSTQFIRLRIKLNDLIPEFSEMLEKKELQVSHAMELCKLDSEEQQEICTGRYREGVSSYYAWNNISSSELKEKINQRFNKLDMEDFDKTDCAGCEFNSKNKNSLFNELEEATCTHIVCFQDKVFNHQVEVAISKYNDGCRLFSYKKTEVVKALEEQEYIVSDAKNTNWIVPKEDEIEKKLELCDITKVYIVDWKQIRYLEVSVKSEAEAMDEEQKESIEALKSKDKRNAEIKVEKIVEDERKLLSESDYGTWGFPITDLERVAMYAIILGYCDYSTKKEIEINFNAEITYLENVKALIGKPIQMQIIRSFIKNKATSGEAVYNKEIQSILSAISKEAYSDEATKIELKHEETYLKRKEKIDEQIKSLS